MCQRDGGVVVPLGVTGACVREKGGVVPLWITGASVRRGGTIRGHRHTSVWGGECRPFAVIGVSIWGRGVALNFNMTDDDSRILFVF